VAQALDIAWAIADALTAAHAKGIVHVISNRRT
jgi:hypothetical protein